MQTTQDRKQTIIRRGLKGWLAGASLKDKMRMITSLAFAVVSLSIAGNMLVAGYGLWGFQRILTDNAKSLTLWNAVDEEKRTFSAYMAERTGKQREAYEAAARQTGKAVRELPFDYKAIGARRYARTWSIRMLYETYTEKREEVLNFASTDELNMDALYSVYRMQDYLQDYAGRLERMNVEAGNQRYEALRPLFVVIPAAALILGAASAAAIQWLRRSADKSLIRPVLALAEDSGRIADNCFDGPEIEADGEDEISQLIRAFYHMKRSTQGYIAMLKEKHEVEKQLDAVRLQLLKNQINPHFLFNTLNMIASMAQVEDAATTEQMITAMSRLFRYNLKSTESVMPLERELKVVSDYMYLQQMRFGKRIRFTTDCAAETQECLVPSFALQPLVENAIVHGLSATREGGKIHIRARIYDGRLTLWVSDTGAGISTERLEQIRLALACGDEKKTGVGLGNIYRRVHTMYGDGEMEIFSRPGRGTVIRLAFAPE